MKELEIFYAVNKSGQGRIFAEMPERDTDRQTWKGQCEGFLVMTVARMEAVGFVLPRITWEDEPVKLKLQLVYEK